MFQVISSRQLETNCFHSHSETKCAFNCLVSVIFILNVSPLIGFSIISSRNIDINMFLSIFYNLWFLCHSEPKCIFNHLFSVICILEVLYCWRLSEFLHKMYQPSLVSSNFFRAERYKLFSHTFRTEMFFKSFGLCHFHNRCVIFVGLQLF